MEGQELASSSRSQKHQASLLRFKDVEDVLGPGASCRLCAPMTYWNKLARFLSRAKETQRRLFLDNCFSITSLRNNLAFSTRTFCLWNPGLSKSPIWASSVVLLQKPCNYIHGNSRFCLRNDVTCKQKSLQTKHLKQTSLNVLFFQNYTSRKYFSVSFPVCYLLLYLLKSNHHVATLNIHDVRVNSLEASETAWMRRTNKQKRKPW